MSIQTFKRLEDKFMISSEQYELLMPRLHEFMECDSYCKDGSYKILNIYFDSPDGEVIRRSIQKPFFKEKLRLRSYGEPSDGDSPVYLELKRKSDGIVNKRRASLTYDEAKRYIETGEKPQGSDYITAQVLREIDRFIEVTGAAPAYFLSYSRIAMVGKKNKNLRLTIDNDLVSRKDELSLTAGCHGRQLLPQGHRLMEIKFLGAIPLDFVKTLSELHIYGRSFSKIGAEYNAELREKKTAAATYD